MGEGNGSLWARWAWRDVRKHLVSVIAIALVLAIGSGVYAGLGSTAVWRRDSNDASFAALRLHDLRVALSPGTFVEQGRLTAVVTGIEAADSIVAASERLVADSQARVDTPEGTVLVAARVVATDLSVNAPVDAVWVRDGERPTPPVGTADGVPPLGILELKFADHRNLPATGSIVVGGGHTVQYSGLGMNPEDFFYEGPEGTVFAEGELAPLYLPLEAGQMVLGRDGMVNDIVIRLADGADADEVTRQLVGAAGLAGVSATVTDRDDVYSFRVLYEDIDNDQRFWNALAGLVLAAATLAAFNLISRIVEAQRREIGIGMALGVSRLRLAIRPMLVGVQVAVLGTILGVGVGFVVGQAMKGLLESFLPLPDYRTAFQVGVYLQAAALGILIPIIAVAIPVWRAVRVEPIEAIRTGHLAAKASRLTDWTRHIRLPGSTFAQMPVRNVLRTPRRTILTAVGVGAAITALVGTLGLLDSFGRSIDEVDAELIKGDPDRIVATLDGFHPVGGPAITAVGGLAEVEHLDWGLRLPVVALAEGADRDDDLDLLLDLVAIPEAEWSPTITSGSVDASSAAPGVVLAEKAATDLGVGIGDPLLVRHPARLPNGAFGLVESEVLVVATHANPIRGFAFMDLDHASLFGLAGLANAVTVYPAEGVSTVDLQAVLFDADGISSTQAMIRIGESFDEAMSQFVGILFITAVAVLTLALLIAFNATRISVDERRREHATMRAYGVSVTGILRVVVAESVIVGLLATAIGVAAGVVFLGWMLQSLASTTLPDLDIALYVAPATLVIAAVVGLIAVMAAPMFLIRRLRRMNIPDTLRVME